MKRRIFILLGICLFGYLLLHSVLPSFPDNQNYANLTERAVAANNFAKSKGLSENYCLFVDYSVPSGTPRMYIWSFAENKVVAETYVMHGPGNGSTAEKPVFSNTPGSNCSSIGRFEVTKEHGRKFSRSYKLRGFDWCNFRAHRRGLMIHRSTWVDRNCHKKYIPLHAPSCEGCITVSSRGLEYLEKLIENEEKNLLLWSYCLENSK